MCDYVLQEEFAENVREIRSGCLPANRTLDAVHSARDLLDWDVVYWSIAYLEISPDHTKLSRYRSRHGPRSELDKPKRR